MERRTENGEERTGRQDPRYDAVFQRDRAADGTFYYGVTTTGVYCKPSCGARRPKQESVRFFETADEARAAGFRACKRCKPDATDDVHAAVVTEACRMLEDAVREQRPVPSLDELARRTGYSPFHLHRLFKRAIGVTPRAYASALRAGTLRDVLPASGSVTQAILEAGYSSTSRFYEVSQRRLGMRPSRARQGGQGETVRFAVGQTSLGAILVAATAKGVCAIHFGDDPVALVRSLEDRFPRADLVGDDERFLEVVARVVAMVESPGEALDLPLDIRGTAFQERVWQALSRIKPGETVTYAEIARRIGSPRAVRAVGQAVGANHLAVAIPCHRVVRTSGELSGYRWGVERKAELLAREATPQNR
jgi:AraC family transcriptional regulator of adaptative response/methylated-DNA-[protein]-cysteine methyltransferase